MTLLGPIGNWQVALTSYHWDFITFQPFYHGTSTLGTDVTTILDWIDLATTNASPDATFYIYGAWPKRSNSLTYTEQWLAPAVDVDSQPTALNSAYMDLLLGRVRSQSGTPIQIIPIGKVWFHIEQLIDAGVITELADAYDLYRDDYHANDIGKSVIAWTLYASLFKESAVGIDLSDIYSFYGDAPIVMDDVLALKLQHAVDDIVFALQPEPAIDIEKATNGVDADDPNAGDAPQVAPGGLVTWTYLVINIGNEPLNNVAVNDDQIGPIICPKTNLALGESMLCTASGLADDLNTTQFTTVPGLCGGFSNTPMYENKGRATGNGANSGQFVEDQDPSHYCNPITNTLPAAPTIGTATPGDRRAIVSFTLGDLGSGTLVYYKSKCGSKTATSSSSPITVTGLTNGTTYTCTVRAITSVGNSPSSAESNPVKPSAAAP
ncbi:MAG: fibronectin type III domain-containing protein [Gammaproteobacteria bacterium]|nr:fibronectin type III domain-containing protein [Gammaproteobacteria bacterium]